MQHLHGIIPCMIGYWPNPVVHFLLKSSMVYFVPSKVCYKSIAYLHLLIASWIKIILNKMAPRELRPVWPDFAIYWTLGNFLRPLATINLPKSPTFLRKFCEVVKINHFTGKIIIGQLSWTFGDFFLVTLVTAKNVLKFIFNPGWSPDRNRSKKSRIRPVRRRLDSAQYLDQLS